MPLLLLVVLALLAWAAIRYGPDDAGRHHC
jgi:hypothetical protein